MVTKWTILTYIASHNNLEELGQESLQQIAAVGSSQEVIHGVLVDSSMGADRILVGKPGKLKQAEHHGGLRRRPCVRRHRQRQRRRPRAQQAHHRPADQGRGQGGT